jgi:hypothetical protein
MTYRHNAAATALGANIVGCFVILLILSLVGAVCWPYTINTWLVFLGKDPVIVWWQGMLLGFVPGLGQVSIPAAVITWILMLFIA